mgnify:CR=1 FL=1
MNCEIANEKKTIVAANQQLRDIKLIEKYTPEEHISVKIRQIMDLRKKHSDISLRELSDLYEEQYNENLSKSGLNHRFSKIKLMADQIRESWDIK